jgi:hypothetical protein
MPNATTATADKEAADIADMASITQKQFSGKHKEITDEQRQIIDALTADPFLVEEDRADIEQFLSKFPLLWKSYIPVSIIGEGTPSTLIVLTISRRHL